MKAVFEEFHKGGIAADKLYACGGIVGKNPFMMQLYADILGQTIETCAAEQGSAFGAAVYAAVAAGGQKGGYANVNEAARMMGKGGGRRFEPIPRNVEAYKSLYREYKTLHDYFGAGGNEVMHRLR